MRLSGAVQQYHYTAIKYINQYLYANVYYSNEKSAQRGANTARWL